MAIRWRCVQERRNYRRSRREEQHKVNPVQPSLHKGAATMNIRSCLFRFAFGVLVALGASSCEKSGVQAGRDLPAPKVISIDDESFLLAAQMAEIRQTTLSRAALNTSKNEDIRNYAQQVIANYRRALAELADLMKTKNIPHTSAAEEIKLDAMNRLHGLTGSAFDHEFISLMTAEQQATLNSFNSAAETAADPDIRNYAKGVLPLLREDFNTATALEKRLAADNAGSILSTGRDSAVGTGDGNVTLRRAIGTLSDSIRLATPLLCGLQNA